MSRLWVDTNAARGVVELRKLCKLARQKQVEVVIHPQVYLERRRQMRVETGEQWKERLFDDFLQQQGMLVPDFTLNQVRAAAWADELYGRYPTNEDWESAKKKTLGGELRDGFQVLPGQMPMTSDWLIALMVEEDPEARVLTEDGGEEWRHLHRAAPKRALDWNETLEWLDGLPGHEAG